MRCPKCGAFVDDKEEKCFMCGEQLTPQINNIGLNQNNQFISNGFGNSNDGFQTGMNGFNNSSDEFLKKKEEYKNRFNSYKNNPEPKAPKHDKDIFDFFQEHKKGIKIFFLLLLAFIVIFAVSKFIKYKTTPKKDEPILLNLYYQVDDSFTNTAKSNNSAVYTKSGAKGSACSINISYGTSTSGNHVKDYYDAARKALEPEKDKQGNVIDPKEIFITRDSEMTINENKWYFMSVYYRTDVTTQQFNILRYRYYTALYKGYYYDIELVNNSNDATCNSSLDNFVNSLRFIDSEQK